MTAGIGFSIFLFVIGAILTFAVEVDASGFNINTVGIILMVGGLLGLFASLLFWSSFSPWSRRRTVAADAIVEREIGAGRLANIDSEPPHRPHARTTPASRRPQTVVDAASPCAAARFPGEPAWGVGLKVMSVLYWY